MELYTTMYIWKARYVCSYVYAKIMNLRKVGIVIKSKETSSHAAQTSKEY